MNKLILCSMLAVGLCGCENETVVREVVKHTVVHDTIVKYEKCLKSSRERMYGDDTTQLYEVFKRKTDERVFYIDAISLRRNILRNNGKLLTSRLEICNVAGNVLMCAFDFKIDKTTHTFIKEWPAKEYYFTYTQSSIPFGTETVNYFPPPIPSD